MRHGGHRVGKREGGREGERERKRETDEPTGRQQRKRGGKKDKQCLKTHAAITA